MRHSAADRQIGRVTARDPKPTRSDALLTTDDVAGTRFTGTQFRQGYRLDEVDDFRERVLGTLEVLDQGGTISDPVTPEEAAMVTFTRTRGFASGYDIAEVDAFVDEVVATLSTADRVVAGIRDNEAAKRSRISRSDVFGIVRDLVVGHAPEQQPAKTPRVRRIAGRYLQVDAAGIHWRTWTGKSGTVAASDVAAVVLLDVTIATLRGPDILQPYALVVDRSGSPLLRVGLGCWGRQWRAMADFTSFLKGVWRAKDARRRWPSAISFAHAYPYWTAIIVSAAYCAGASLVDALLSGT